MDKESFQARQEKEEEMSYLIDFFEYVIKPLLLGVCLVVSAFTIAMIFAWISDLAFIEVLGKRIPAIPPKLKNVIFGLVIIGLLWLVGAYFLFRE